jgi:cytosolic carboxypeptidase protein 2/3
MRVDANTRGHLQWYYFKMFNMIPGTTYQLNLCNFQKAKSLYSRGMKPYLFSHRNSEEKGIGWRQAGSSI